MNISKSEQIRGVNRSGLELWDREKRRMFRFPFTQIDGDSYRIAEFDEAIRVVYNEKSMGLFF